MQTIRRRLSILFVICSIAAILLITLFVNITVNNKFNKYMIDIQNNRYQRIVSYFEEIFKRDGRWVENSGVEMMHEAYMGNYCLTLRDENKKVIWGMDPNDIRIGQHLNAMPVKNQGVYSSKSFEIKSDGILVGYVDIGQYSSVLLSEEDVNFIVSINKSILISGVLALAIIIFLSLYFSKQFSRPIKEVANMSVGLSKGNFDEKSNSKSNIQELEDLRRSINILAEKLKNQDMLRKRLVSDISHEIRTPLNILQNNLEAMIDGVFPVTNDRLNYLNDEVVRFGRLLNNLNLLKEFESEGIKLNLESINLDGLIKTIYNDFYLAAEGKNIKLDYEQEPDKDFIINGDRDKLIQVFINLISNALKFTEPGGWVGIKLYTNNKSIIVEIRDSGIGIKEGDIPFIFERLYRGDRSRHQTEGNGIGLTIVKNILQIHNGSIDVESIEGKGTTVRIAFHGIG